MDSQPTAEGFLISAGVQSRETCLKLLESGAAHIPRAPQCFDAAVLLYEIGFLLPPL